MIFKKKKELTVETIMDLGYPPIFSHKIIDRIESLKQRNPSLKQFKPHDFCTLTKWLGDQEKLAKDLNSVLNDRS